jgi:glycosyltransferase involved in cell wall biosynthesis
MALFSKEQKAGFASGLCYILPEYDPATSQHFGHVPQLLAALAKRVPLAVVVEKGVGPLNIPGLKELVFQKKKGKLSRLVELFVILWRLHRQGYRTFFVRISTVGGLAAAAVRRFKGGQAVVWRSGVKFVYPWGLNLPAIKSKLLVEFPFWLTLRAMDWLATGPESMVAYMRENYRLDAHRVRLLYNDIDLTYFHPLPSEQSRGWREKLSIPEGAKVVLSVQRLSPARKVCDYLPLAWEMAMAAFPQAIFILVGDGVDLAKLRQKVEASPVAQQARLAGMLPLRDLREIYSLADVFLMPTWGEGFPRVLVEAMAMGLPVAATDAGGIRDILPEAQLPFMADRHDPAALGRALVTILSDDDLARRLAQANLERVKRYDTQAVADMYVRALSHG